MLQYKEREVQLLSSDTPIKMSSFFNDLCVVDSLLISLFSFYRGCQNGSVHVWTLPQGGTVVSLPNILNAPLSQDKSTNVKVSSVLLLEFLHSRLC